MKEVCPIFKCNYCGGSEYGVPRELPPAIMSFLEDGGQLNVKEPRSPIIHQCFRDRIDPVTVRFFGLCEFVGWREVLEKKEGENE